MMFRAFSAIFVAAFLVTLGQSRPNTSNNHAGGLRSARQLDSTFPEVEIAPPLPDSRGSGQGIGGLFNALFALSDAIMDSPLVKSLDQIKKTECDPDHQSFGDSCYFFSTAKADWVTAQDTCRGMGGNLVKISNDNEFNFLKDQMTENRWVGFSDQDSEGQFKWIADDSTFPVNSPWWHNGEPNDRSGKEDCGEFYWMHSTFMLNDNVCTGWELTYICEMELPYIEP